MNKFRSAWIQILRTKSEVLKKLDDQRLFDFLIDYARLGDSWFQSNNGAAPIVKEVYKDDGYCYIATMVYGDYNHPSVIQLRNFRDNKLNKCQLGRLFIKYYYKYSPYLIKSLQDKFLINKFLTIILDIIVNKIKK